MALAEARGAALTNRRAARAGGDPLAERRRERASAVTFEAVAREVFELKRTKWKNAKHTSQWIGSPESWLQQQLQHDLWHAQQNREDVPIHRFVAA